MPTTISAVDRLRQWACAAHTSSGPANSAPRRPELLPIGFSTTSASVAPATYSSAPIASIRSRFHSRYAAGRATTGMGA